VVFRVEFGRLAVENQALNLGQGFPDYFPPSYVTEALKQVAESSNPFIHQYTRSYVRYLSACWRFYQFYCVFLLLNANMFVLVSAEIKMAE